MIKLEDRIMSQSTTLVDFLIDSNETLYEYCAYAMISFLDPKIIANELKQMVEELKPDIELDSVNWLQIAENLLKDNPCYLPDDRL